MSGLLVFQSGGPTAVLNASLTGIITEARNSFATVYGSQNGLVGAAAGELIRLDHLSDERLERLKRTPSAGLGTSRFRPTETELERIVVHLRDFDIEAVIAIGGNDTADTALRLEHAARAANWNLRVIAIPKTIDNDLAVTDHSLGYPSAARCLATITRDALFDSMATATLYPVKVIEVMGRNAGWLAAACSLAIPEDLPPPFTILPERPLQSEEDVLDRIQQRVTRDRFVLIVVPETARWADGSHLAGSEPKWIDAFGHPYFPSAGNALTDLCSIRLGLRARLDRPGSFTRASIDLASRIDLDEAERCGKFAVQSVMKGDHGSCVVIRREPSESYASYLELAPLDAIANVEWTLPDAMIDAGGTEPSEAFHLYARPLLGDPFEEYEVLIRD